MNKANNNEMDLALHSLAKSERDGLASSASSSLWDRNEPSGDHLDADELNSYAEGLVPEAARLRYTEHLADCANCRKIVVDLTQALGIAAPALKSETDRGTGLWDKVFGFLSLPVLRYGIPAIALTAILAIGFLALRKEPQADLVARNEPGNVTAPAPAMQDSQGETKQAPVAITGNYGSPAPTPAPAASIDTAATKNATAPKEKVDATLDGTDSTVEHFLKDKPASPPPPAPVAAAKSVASEPKFSEAPKVGTLSNEVQKSADRKQETPTDTLARQRDAARPESRREAEEDTAAFRKDSPSGPQRGGLMGERGGYGRKAAKREAADDDETKTIAGRRFRRQGNVWIDTAYASSQATISVKRGSEQFRALIADEPEIRNIANALGGEIILVWKAKAYRIR
ncbi:MAG TPA: zf-HC2 domain-containing protein [Pyrinomonadaceae bacterium]|nr:zf-HC2 domain-containing protein [Pyrinomonadaceae bacterium]